MIARRLVYRSGPVKVVTALVEFNQSDLAVLRGLLRRILARLDGRTVRAQGLRRVLRRCEAAQSVWRRR